MVLHRPVEPAGGKRKADRKRKTDLTLTGLLMEGTMDWKNPG
jgi:hypothetical protein